MTQTPTRSPISTASSLGSTDTQPLYEITDEDRRRQQKIADAWQAYNGELDEPLQRMDGQPNDNVLSNRCSPIVDAGVSFLFGKELEISVEEGAPQAAQDFLDDVWGRKETRIPLLQNLAINGALAGQAFLRIVPDNRGNYRLVEVDPSTVFVQTAPQDCKTVLLYCIQYSTQEKIEKKWVEVFYREEIARIDPDDNASQGMPDTDDTWVIQHWSKIGAHTTNWTSAGPAILWPYAFPPLLSCQNLPNPNNFWGRPDITPDLIGMNKSLNLVNSLINRVNKLYGTPILYATGTGESVIDIKPGKIIGLGQTESKIVAVPIASDITNALQFATDLRSDIDEQSQVPSVATGRIKDMPRGSLSGIAIELLFMSLLKKTEKKQCLFGELIIDVSQALLVLNGMSGDIDITLAWQSPIPHDDLPAIQAAIAKKELGISDTTLMRELSYDPDEEMDLSKTEDALKLANFANGQGIPSTPLPSGIPGVPTLPGQTYPVPAPGQSGVPGQPAGGQG